MSLRACAVIPAYNAAATLGPLAQQIRQLGLDLVIVDDGSTDETARVATQTGTMVISHLRNQGKGAALRTGFAYAVQAGYEVVVTLDSDGQHDPADIPRLLEAASQPDGAVVIGCRTLARGSMPFARRWVNRLMSRVVSVMARHRIPDSQCGLRVIRREVLQAVRLSGRRFDLETELLLAAAHRGWRARSVPIRTIYHQRASHIDPIVDGLRFMRLIAWYSLGLHQWNGPAQRP